MPASAASATPTPTARRRRRAEERRIMRSAVVNLGTIVSGDLAAPLASGDTIILDGGLIAKVGTASATELESCDVVIDAGGATAIPGLIDSHVHITFGDYTPRQKTVGFLESYLHGGITTAVSASEVHVPGRPPTLKASRRWRSRRSVVLPPIGRAACGWSRARSFSSPASPRPTSRKSRPRACGWPKPASACCFAVRVRAADRLGAGRRPDHHGSPGGASIPGCRRSPPIICSP